MTAGRPGGRRWRQSAAVFVAVWILAGAGPAWADEADEPKPPSFSPRAVYKTMTYQAVSAFDDFMFGVMFGGGVAAGGVLLATSVVTEPVLYYLHEMVWGTLAPRTGTAELELVPAKTATYTLTNMGRVFATGWLLTGSPLVGAGFVAFNAVGDAAAYALNDVAWVYFAPIPDTAAGVPE